MYNINDPKNYKRCQKKKYHVWVCMPPLGTCVVNKLEQAEIVKQLNGKTYFTASQMHVLAEKNPKVYEFLSKNAYIIDEKKRFVLSGTQGEMWTIDANKLASTYVFAGNVNKPDEDISPNSLKERCLKGENMMNWQLLETRTVKGSNFACQVPANETFTLQTSWGSTLKGNDPLIPHGKGDFVMCPANPDNTPNLNDRWIVNGLIFGDTYDNRGWSQNVVSSGEGSKFVEKPDVDLMDKNAKNLTKIETPVVETTPTMPNVEPAKKQPQGSSKQRANDLLNMFGGKKKAPAKSNVAGVKSEKSNEPLPSMSEETPKKKSKQPKYQMVARCTDGFKVTGYMLKSVDNSGNAVRFSKQQTYFLIGKRQVVNCDGKISKEGISLSGIGVKITDLPMIDENGSIRNAEHTGHVRRGDKAEDIINRNMLVGIVKNGRRTEGYILKGAGGATSFCSKEDVYKLAQEKKIGNVSAQLYNGKLLIRSIAGQPSLSTLPIMDRNGNIVKEKMDYADYKKGSKETA